MVEICGSGVVTSMDDVATTTVVVINVVLILEWLIDIEDGVGTIDDKLIRGTDDKEVVDTDKGRVESDGWNVSVVTPIEDDSVVMCAVLVDTVNGRNDVSMIIPVAEVNCDMEMVFEIVFVELGVDMDNIPEPFVEVTNTCGIEELVVGTMALVSDQSEMLVCKYVGFDVDAAEEYVSLVSIL